MIDPISMPNDIPTLLRRDEVPLYFPQFTSANSLAYLAHKGTGPLYKTICGRAWYARDDIIEWLAADKASSPRSSRRRSLLATQVKGAWMEATKRKTALVNAQPTGARRGRMSKFEKAAREQAAEARS